MSDFAPAQEPQLEPAAPANVAMRVELVMDHYRVCGEVRTNVPRRLADVLKRFLVLAFLPANPRSQNHRLAFVVELQNLIDDRPRALPRDGPLATGTMGLPRAGEQ